MTPTGSDDPALDDLIVLAKAEADGTAVPALVSMGPFTAYTLIGMIQLACRHPDTSEAVRRTGRDFVAQFAGLFSGPIAESIERGWDGG